MKEVHDRMPLVLTKEQADAWLHDPGEARRILYGVSPELDRYQWGNK